MGPEAHAAALFPPFLVLKWGELPSKRAPEPIGGSFKTFTHSLALELTPLRGLKIGAFLSVSIMGAATNSPKMEAFRANPKIALTEVVDGVAPEFLQASRRSVPPEQWEEFEQGVGGLYRQQGRSTIMPERAKLIDFETRVPQAQEELVAQQSGNK